MQTAAERGGVFAYGSQSLAVIELYRIVSQRLAAPRYAVADEAPGCASPVLSGADTSDIAAASFCAD